MMLERGKNQKPEDGSKKEMGPRAHLKEPVFVMRRMIILCMYVHMHINTHTHTPLYLCNWHRNFKNLHVSILPY